MPRGRQMSHCMRDGSGRFATEPSLRVALVKPCKPGHAAVEVVHLKL